MTVLLSSSNPIVLRVDWPFLLAADPSSRSVGWAVVNGPIVTHAHHAQLAALSGAGYRFAGMASYMSFPLPDGEDARDYHRLCEVWCHCFRDPDRYLPPGVPRTLLSVSDFTNYQRISPGLTDTAADDGARYDFVYVGAVERWKKRTKNWQLAARCIPRLCAELGLRALVIGESEPDFPPFPGVTFSPHLPWHAFLVRLRRSRFLFVPNVLDASPRVLAEALCLDVPLIVHEDIVGGWKYVNAFSGTFFADDRNVVAAARRLLARPTRPRDWFRSHHGPYLAGQQLLRLLRAVDPKIAETSHLILTECVASEALDLAAVHRS